MIASGKTRPVQWGRGVVQGWRGAMDMKRVHRDGGRRMTAPWRGMTIAMLVWTTVVAAAPPEPLAERMAALRERMVRDDIAAGGVVDPRILESMRGTPRHEFVPPPQRHLAP